MEDIPPDSRARVLEVHTKAGGRGGPKMRCGAGLQSGSMKKQNKNGKNSIQDLLISLKARKGRSYLGMVAFPGGDGRDSRVVSTLTRQF